METEGGEEKKRKKIFPTLLDVIKFRGKEHQVVSVQNMGEESSEPDGITLKDEDGGVVRIKGGHFKPADQLEDPKMKNVYRKDEGVKNTGDWEGGEIEGEE